MSPKCDAPAAEQMAAVRRWEDIAPLVDGAGRVPSQCVSWGQGALPVVVGQILLSRLVSVTNLDPGNILTSGMSR